MFCKLKGPLFTMEDAKAAFSLFCCIYGVGTLGMPVNYSRAGPVAATLALLFMACANSYAALCLSRSFLAAPKTVRTIGDLAEWSLGKWGRAFIILFQLGCCLLIPCLYLVLGGTLLDTLFPDAFSKQVWIILMALTCIPTTLTPTLKEGAMTAAAACAGTVLADFIGVGALMWYMRGHPTVPAPDVSFKQIANCFGNLSLAYGAALVIPTLHREHSDPRRLPRVIICTLVLISCLFLIVATMGYSAAGCQINSNILYSIADGSLGFDTKRGTVIMAYLFMQLHITVAFSVVLFPALYLLERWILRMHQKDKLAFEAGQLDDKGYEESVTPSDTIPAPARRSSNKNSIVSVADLETDDDYEHEVDEYKGLMNQIKYMTLRIVVIVILCVIAAVFYDKFSSFQDFVGAWATAGVSIVMPMLMYMKIFWKKMHIIDKIICAIIALVCTAFGAYVTYNTGKTLFVGDDDSDISFPFCKAENQDEVYYTRSS